MITCSSEKIVTNKKNLCWMSSLNPFNIGRVERGLGVMLLGRYTVSNEDIQKGRAKGEMRSGIPILVCPC